MVIRLAYGRGAIVLGTTGDLAANSFLQSPGISTIDNDARSF